MKSLPLRHAHVMLMVRAVIGRRLQRSRVTSPRAHYMYLAPGSALTESVTINLQHEALCCARVPHVLSRVSDEPGVGRVFMRDVSSTGRVLQLRHR